MNAKIRAALDYPWPKSYCRCGHEGDGVNSLHDDSGLAAGHGPCHYCPPGVCTKFSRMRWIQAFENYLQARARIKKKAAAK